MSKGSKDVIPPGIQSQAASIPELDGDIVFVELCAGSAVLSSVAKQKKLKIFPVDCSRNRHTPYAKVHQLDLTQESSWEVLDALASNSKIAAWHFGLPCGTCSKARGIPLPDGSPGPPILRTWQHLMGVPDMTSGDRTKVDQANLLYTKAAAFIDRLLDARHFVVIENPSNSWLWSLPMMRRIVQRCLFVHLHACMFGSQRKKKTSLLTNIEALLEMGILCDDSHPHAEWGLDEQNNFNTAKEAEYPRQFCEVYIDIVLHLCEAQGWVNSDNNRIASPPLSQPRGRKTRPLIPEFKMVRSIMLSRIPALDHKKKLRNAISDIPAGSKLLRAEAKTGNDNRNVFLCVFGIYFSMVEFYNNSLTVQHPFDDFMHIPDILLECICDILVLGPVEISKRRLQTIKELKDLRISLEAEEAKLHMNIPSHIRTILASKQLLMLERLAGTINWPDEKLHDEIRNGFRLVGMGTKSNIFKPDFKPATITEDELMKKAKFLRPALIGKLKNQQEDELLQELRTITAAEAENKGWLTGPHRLKAIQDEFQNEWLPVVRFAVRQKNKTRPIDNFAENGVNDAWSSPEKLDLHSVDHVTWLIGVLCKMVFHRKCIDVTLKCGKKIMAPLHDDWISSNAKCMLTTQKDDRNKAIVALKAPNDEGVEFYGMSCLPFGAVSSVHNFNRIARLVWALGVKLLRIPWLNYYDDYPVVSPAAISGSTLSSAKTFLRLLGLKFSEAKLEPFKSEAEILGVVVDCSSCHLGDIQYRMKESRRTEILSELRRICEDRSVIPAALPSSLGRIQFAEGQLQGRAGKLAMADIRELGTKNKKHVHLEGDHLRAFSILKARFEKNTERCIQVSSPGSPAIVFTDGSFEPDEDGMMDETGIGGILIRDGKLPQVFGCKVPTALLDRWRAAGKEHLIGQVELYGVLVARSLWREELHNRRSIFFIDNWGVLDCVVPGTSKDSTWREMLMEMEEIDASFPTFIWAARVPSESNLADPPSRGHMNGLEFLGECEFVKPTCPLLGIPMECVV